MSRLYPNRAPREFFLNEIELRENPNARKIPLHPKYWWRWTSIETRIRSPLLKDILYQAKDRLRNKPPGTTFTHPTTFGSAQLLVNLYQAAKLYAAAGSIHSCTDLDTIALDPHLHGTEKDKEPRINKEHPEFGWGNLAFHLPSVIIHGKDPTLGTALAGTSRPINKLSPASFVVTVSDKIQAEDKLRMIHAAYTEEKMFFSPGTSASWANMLLRRLQAMIGDDPYFWQLPARLKDCRIRTEPEGISMVPAFARHLSSVTTLEELERQHGFTFQIPKGITTIEPPPDRTAEWQPQPQPQPEPEPQAPYIYEISIREEEDLQEAFGTSTPEIIAHLAQTPSLEELVGQWGPDILDILSPETLDRLPAQDDPYALDQIISASDLTTP